MNAGSGQPLSREVGGEEVGVLDEDHVGVCGDLQGRLHGEAAAGVTPPTARAGGASRVAGGAVGAGGGLPGLA